MSAKPSYAFTFENTFVTYPDSRSATIIFLKNPTAISFTAFEALSYENTFSLSSPAKNGAGLSIGPDAICGKKLTYTAYFAKLRCAGSFPLYTSTM